MVDAEFIEVIRIVFGVKLNKMLFVIVLPQAFSCVYLSSEREMY